MCDRCVPRLTRRHALLLAGGALAGAALPDWTGGSRVDALAATAVDVAEGLSVQPRSVWAGDQREPVGPIGPEDVRFLLVHHTASANGAEPIGTMRGVYNFHTGPDRGWPDVAYNFFIDEAGVVYEARGGSLAGPVEASATGGSQGFAQLVCLLGDFTSQNPTDAALASLTLTLAWLADRYGIDTAPGATTEIESRGSNRWPTGEIVDADNVAGHREMSQTACPGDTFYPYLKSVIWPDVDRVGAAESVVTEPTSTTAATTSSLETSPETAPSAPTSTDSPSERSTPVSSSVVSLDETPLADEVLPMPSVDVPSAGEGGDDSGVSPFVVIGGAAVATGAVAMVASARRGSRSW